MNKNEHESAPKSAGITFAIWRSAPLSWSQWAVGRGIVKASDGLLGFGLWLVDTALKRITAIALRKRGDQ